MRLLRKPDIAGSPRIRGFARRLAGLRLLALLTAALSGASVLILVSARPVSAGPAAPSVTPGMGPCVWAAAAGPADTGRADTRVSTLAPERAAVSSASSRSPASRQAKPRIRGEPAMSGFRSSRMMRAPSADGARRRQPRYSTASLCRCPLPAHAVQANSPPPGAGPPGTFLFNFTSTGRQAAAIGPIVTDSRRPAEARPGSVAYPLAAEPLPVALRRNGQSPQRGSPSAWLRRGSRLRGAQARLVAGRHGRAARS